MRRIPLPPFPNGWFSVCYRDEVATGQAKPVHLMGKDLVVFRGEDGKARVFDAFCPHLGAHLGYGGKVEGNNIRCPFHAWLFDGGTGKCLGAPYASRTPEKAQVLPWPTLEQNDIVYFYHHVDRAAPDWEPDVIPEVGAPDYYRFDTREWTLRSHPQEIMENGVDYAHFLTLHKWDTVAMRWTPNGVRYSLEIDVDTESQKQAATAQNAVQVNSYNSGPGFLFTRVRGPMDGIAMNMLTPVDEEVVRVQHAYYAHKRVPREVVEQFFAAYEKDWGLDFPIWDNKLHLRRPMLTETEGDVPRFRKWYRQFYTDRQLAEVEAAG